MMNIVEFLAKAKAEYKKKMDDYEYIGIRFENKIRIVGEICGCSRHNTDRIDQREFPVYGTAGYDEIEELGGVSCWDLRDESSVYKIPGYVDKTNDCTRYYLQDHCYIVVGDAIAHTDDIIDEDEIIIVAGAVAAILF